MQFEIEIVARDEAVLERALHDAAVALRCKLRGIAQRSEFHYLDGGRVRVREVEMREPAEEWR